MNFFVKGNDVIEKEGKKLLDEINSKIRNKSFENNTELTYFYKEKILKLYDDINYPKFQPCFAIDTLVKDEYSNMIDSLYKDIESSITNSQKIYDVVCSKTEEMNLTKKSLIESNRFTDKEIRNLKDSVEEFSEIGFSSFTDSFNDNEINSSSDNKNPKGFITLPYKSYQDLTSSAIIEILDTNALPGNTHVATNSYSGIVYDGEIEPMLTLDSILDTNKETRFECELFEVDEDVYDSCNGAGFIYKEGISWLNKDNKIFINLRIKLKTKQVANWFSITPFIPSSELYVNSMIKKIIISDGQNDIKKMIEDTPFNDTVIILFKEMQVQYVDVLIEQSNPYEVEVAHDIVVKSRTNTNYFDNKLINQYERVNIPVRSVTSLGVKCNQKNKSVEIPSSDKKSNISTNSINDIFGTIINDSSYEYALETIRAKRYNISINNINIGNYNFESKYTYISKRFICNNEINSIILNANDSLDDENIKYLVTLDEGSTWIRLYPKERAYKGPCCIKINSHIPIYERDSKIIYIDKLTNVDSILLKIELTKPNNNVKVPIVYDYKLNITSGGESYDNQ